MEKGSLQEKARPFECDGGGGEDRSKSITSNGELC